MCVNNWFYGLKIIFVCLHITLSHYLHHADITKILNMKCVSGILRRVCLRSSLFSELSFMQYMRLGVFRLHVSLLIVVRIVVLVLINTLKSEIQIISYFMGLGHEKNGIDCMSCYVLICSFVFFIHSEWRLRYNKNDTIQKYWVYQSVLKHSSRLCLLNISCRSNFLCDSPVNSQ